MIFKKLFNWFKPSAEEIHIHLHLDDINVHIQGNGKSRKHQKEGASHPTERLYKTKENVQRRDPEIGKIDLPEADFGQEIEN